MKLKDNLLIYRSFYDAAKELTNSERHQFWDAVMGYGFEGIMPEIRNRNVKMAFIFAKPQIDANYKKYIDGQKGGRPKNKTGGFENEKPNDKEKVNDKEKENVKEKGKFISPTLEEVEEYCRQRNNSVDAKRFHDYFEASGWIDSTGKPVKNWKQKVITWEAKGNGMSERQAGAAHSAAPKQRDWGIVYTVDGTES